MYCVPFVVQKLTGSLECLEASLGKGETARGIFDGTYIDALRRAGLRVERLESIESGKHTVLRVVKALPNGTHLIRVQGHLLMTIDGVVFDNEFSYGSPPQRYPHKLRKVLQVWSVQ